MTLYEFRCDECGVVFDHWGKMGEVGWTTPCDCGGLARRNGSAPFYFGVAFGKPDGDREAALAGFLDDHD